MSLRARIHRHISTARHTNNVLRPYIYYNPSSSHTTHRGLEGETSKEKAEKAENDVSTSAHRQALTREARDQKRNGEQPSAGQRGIVKNNGARYRY